MRRRPPAAVHDIRRIARDSKANLRVGLWIDGTAPLLAVTPECEMADQPDQADDRCEGQQQ